MMMSPQSVKPAASSCARIACRVTYHVSRSCSAAGSPVRKVGITETPARKSVAVAYSQTPRLRTNSASRATAAPTTVRITGK
jgi:hypothetical protein